MKNIPRFIPGAAIILMAMAISSCHKSATPPESNGSIHYLGFKTDRVIKVNEAVVIYDSTALRDSIDFSNPPTNRIYDWTVLPAGKSYTFGGLFKNGLAEIVFQCSGHYLVTASIYDSLTHHLLGHTDTIGVTVTTDTLYPYQLIGADDELLLAPGIVISRNLTNPSLNEVYISIVMYTSRQYEYPAQDLLDYTFVAGINNYEFVFSDKVLLSSYPYAWGAGIKGAVWADADLHGLTPGAPATVSITWLGHTYTGTITLLNDHLYNFNWDNSGAVKVATY